MPLPTSAFTRAVAVLVALGLVLGACSSGGEGDPEGTTTTTVAADTTVSSTEATSTSVPPTSTTTEPLPPPDFSVLEGIHRGSRYVASFGDAGLARWEREVPGIQDVRIPSTIDGAEQEVLWLPPTGDQPQPLLVALHSWSTAYLQHVDIPYGMWAQHNGWGFIHPNFRGVNDRPEALGSDLAVQDVVDAIDFAIEQGGVDPERVYVIGLSGGGLMALLLAGRHPDRIAGAAAWMANYDLVDFYAHSRRAGRSYYRHIATACGGNPTTDEAARDECMHRSPAGHLDAARDGGVPVYLGHGISDTLAPPIQSAHAFNHLAAPEDQLPEDLLEAIAAYRIPDTHLGIVETETYFGDADPAVLFAVESGTVRLVIIEGSHDMVYQPALRWFASNPRE